MGQSMHGWKADDFFVAVRQHLDSLGPRGLEELRIAFTKAAANIASVFRRLNNEQLGHILENVQTTTKSLQQLDVNVFHEALKSVQHTSNAATHKLTQLDVNHLHDTLKAVQLMVNTITKNVQHLDVKSSNEILKSLHGASDATAQKLAQFNINQPKEALNAFQQFANIILATKTLPKALDTLKYTLPFTGLTIVLTIWIIIRLMRNLEKHTDRISAVLQARITEIALQGNLYHQHEFATSVYNFVALKRTEQILYPGNYPLTNDPSDARYVVFHPGSDWHAGFFAIQSDGWNEKLPEENEEGHILKRVKLFNNPEKFAAYLHDRDGHAVAEEIGSTTSITHILLPSAHMYTLPFTLHIPKHIHPVRVVGQTDHNGKPYCRARIIALDSSDVIDVDLLSESEAPDYALRKAAPDQRLYPVLWLIVVALWLKDMLAKVVDLAREIVWAAWNAYLGLREFLSFGVTKFLLFGA
jgi:hypothetical protein